MKPFLLALGAVFALSACAPTMPDSNPGVGFGNYDRFEAEQRQRDAELRATRASAVPTDARIGEETLAVLAATRPVQTTPPPAATSDAPLTAMAPTPGNPNISDEQSFDAVSGRETIQSDAERLRQQRLARQEIAAVPVPERGANGRPNVVAFALATENAVGQSLYRRSGILSTSRFQRNCAQFASWDQAQEEFLALGGPGRDRRGLDPDGDGFACFWDPAPYRAVRGR